MSPSDSPIGRRDFMKYGSVLATGATASLAGCTGGGDGSSGSTTDETTSATDGSSGTGTTTSGTDISGVTLPYWTWWPSQSEFASEQVKQYVADFEQEHGLTIQPNYSSFGDVAGGKWQQNIAGGTRPAVFNSNNFLSGQFIEPGWVEPADNYIDSLDDSALDGMEWSLDLARNVYKGYDAEIVEVPVSLCMSRPFVARMDHFEEAGLDPEEDFPPTSYDHLVQVATQLQEDGPADYGYQIFGDQGDITDETLAMWTTAEGGADGLYLTPEWTDVNFDNAVWKEWFQKYVDIYRKHELSHPNTPSMSDEQSVQLLIDGKISMMQFNSLSHGILLSRAPEMIQDGTIQYGPMWKGAADNRGAYFIYAAGIMTAPDGASEDEWARKQAAGVELINGMLSDSMQQNLHKITGGAPVNRNVWEDIQGQNHGLGEAMVQTAEDTIPEVGWSSHPQHLSAMFGDTPPLMQNALRGKIEPDEALEQAAERARQQINFNN